MLARAATRARGAVTRACARERWRRCQGEAASGDARGGRGTTRTRATMEREREWGREKRERASGDERTRRGAGDGGETKVG